jgi:hypothetical protein
MPKPLALLVGGSSSALPFLQILKQEGYIVIVVGKNASEPCHSLADGSLLIDYSDKEALLSICKNYQFDFIIPTCNDYSYLSCAYVADKLNLIGFDSENIAQTIHTKQKFKNFASTICLKTPQPIQWDSLSNCEKLNVSQNKLIVKPDDAFSGIGVSISHDITTLENAISNAKHASRNGKFVIEFFFEGTLHSHSCFLQNGKIFNDFLVDEFCLLNSFQVNCSTYPSRLGNNAIDLIRDEVEILAAKLSLADGLLHTQFLWNGDDLQIVECMRRCPGDLYGRQLELSHGYPYHFNVIAPYLGKSFREADPIRNIHPVGRHTLGSLNKSMLSAVRIASTATAIEFVPLKVCGEYISGERTDKAGIIFFVYDVDHRFSSDGCDYPKQVNVISDTHFLSEIKL